MTIADNIQDLVTAKADMKAALQAKGVTPTGGLSTYADAIRSIEGEYIVGNMDFSKIYYNENDHYLVNKLFNDEIAKSEEFLKKFNNGEITNFSGKSLMFAPNCDLSKVSDTSIMFAANYDLIYVPAIDISNSTTADSMFDDCHALKSITISNTSKVRRMDDMFYGCYSLENVSALDLSNTITAAEMFYDCKKLKSVNLINTSKLEDMRAAFYYCWDLTDIYISDTSNVDDFNATFSHCGNLKHAPNLDTSSAYSVTSMFHKNFKLQSMPLYDFSKVRSCGDMVYDCNNLTDLEGFYNLGKVIDIGGTATMFSYATKITRQSCLNVFNNLYDRASAGYSVLNLGFESEVTDRLTADDIAIATNKGWTIVSY